MAYERGHQWSRQGCPEPACGDSRGNAARILLNLKALHGLEKHHEYQNEMLCCHCEKTRMSVFCPQAKKVLLPSLLPLTSISMTSLLSIPAYICLSIDLSSEIEGKAVCPSEEIQLCGADGKALTSHLLATPSV
jgi:hypothetical protein